MAPRRTRSPSHSGPRLASVSGRAAAIGAIALVVVLAGCSGITLLPEDDDPMVFMNHTATGDMNGTGVSTNDSATTNGTIADSELVTFQNQISDGTKVTVQSITVANGGYAVIHNGQFATDGTDSVIGVSEYLEPGSHENVAIILFDVPGRNFNDTAHLMGKPRLVAVAHHETNGNQTFEYVSSDTNLDTAYRNDTGAIVAGSATVTVWPN